MVSLDDYVGDGDGHADARRIETMTSRDPTLIFLALGCQHRPRMSARSGAPIERLFARLKALLRKAAARARDARWQAIGRLLAAVPPVECANYLDHCGMVSPKVKMR